ncbi:uncharacterized protein A4U43_C10F8110 [Asparagus officinalis]|uniref:Uncharacterized protein n=1 Tax=Asparagus officinalis TaxID=4686 RepID=A0A5P1E5X1_ASPOF|nr:uncharacterized protein A4U43_C10F8110 [Asparagus officinalis]
MQWENCDDRVSSVSQSKSSGLSLESNIASEAKMATIMRRLEALEVKERAPAQINHISAPGCHNCQSPTHVSEECPLRGNNHALEQMNAAFQHPRNDPFSPTYNPEKGLEAMIKASTQTTNMLTQSSTTLNSFMQTTGQVLNSNTQAIARLDTQLGQLAAAVSKREKGKFLSQPVANPKDTGSSSNNPAQLNAIHTLRSGKQIDNQVRMPPDQTPSPIQNTPSDESIPSDDLSNSFR